MGSVQRDVMCSVPRDVMFSPASHTDEDPSFRLSLRDARPPMPTNASPSDFDLRDDSASQDAGDFGHLISALNARYLEIINGKLDVKTLADLLELELDQKLLTSFQYWSAMGGRSRLLLSLS